MAALKKLRSVKAAANIDADGRPLPAGWTRVESRSKPGQYVFENLATDERQLWSPLEVVVAAPPSKSTLSTYSPSGACYSPTDLEICTSIPEESTRTLGRVTAL